MIHRKKSPERLEVEDKKCGKVNVVSCRKYIATKSKSYLANQFHRKISTRSGTKA